MEKDCSWCSNPGKNASNEAKFCFTGIGTFRDLDSDFGGGVDVCQNCVGTGRVSDNQEFIKLSTEASKLRLSNCTINSKADQGLITQEELSRQRLKNNSRLLEISQIALSFIEKPNKLSFSVKYKKQIEDDKKAMSQLEKKM